MIRDIISTESGDNISVYLHNQLMIMITVVLALILLSPSRRQGSHYPFWVALYLLLQLLERERAGWEAVQPPRNSCWSSLFTKQQLVQQSWLL